MDDKPQPPSETEKDYYSRKDALELAINYNTALSMPVSSVIETARLFAAYLKGE